MCIEKRLLQARECLKKTQKEIASMANISVRAYINYENGQREVPRSVMNVYSQLGVNVNWLLSGEGEMLCADNHTLPNGVSIYPSPRMQKMDNGLLAVSDMVYVPMSTVTACCGEGFMIYPQDCDINDSVVVNKNKLGELAP
ncbi:MAG: helix-turn-helix transcriptional regulator, partial [Synergistaceae bacterium]|nr:helix-turn-helix transcriptional regulator [Synergistaceae bacterium]